MAKFDKNLSQNDDAFFLYSFFLNIKIFIFNLYFTFRGPLIQMSEI